MKNDLRSRKWQITINNPSEHGCTHDFLKEQLEKIGGLVYYCFADEVGGETETYHTHLFLYVQNAVRFTRIKKLFPKAHIEYVRGTCAENRDYIFKIGKWSNDPKTKTNIKDTHFEFGTLPVERQGARNDLSELLDMVKSGMTNAEIIEENNAFVFNIDKIDKMRQTVLESQYRSKVREIKCQYIFGKTGTGKSWGIFEKYGFEKVYRVTDYKHPFDGYQQQPVIVFEEFRSSLSISDMLNFLDIYPLSLPCRYNNKIACYTDVFIVSNIDLEHQYSNIQVDNVETWRAFLRRINNGLLHYIGNDKVVEYKAVDEYLATGKLPF